jgi:hypothetical protein
MGFSFSFLEYKPYINLFFKFGMPMLMIINNMAKALCLPAIGACFVLVMRWISDKAAQQSCISSQDAYPAGTLRSRSAQHDRERGVYSTSPITAFRVRCGTSNQKLELNLTQIEYQARISVYHFTPRSLHFKSKTIFYVISITSL